VLTKPPARLVVVGAGYIGMELASVFANLGSDVMVLEALEGPLPAFEPALTEPVLAALEDKSITFRFERRATGWRETANGVKVLVAVGRKPVTEGFVETDAKMRTTNDRVFAVGDVAGEPMLAHKANHEGLIAAEALGGGSPTARDRTVPAVVYTHPEIATAGLGLEAAAAAGYTPAVGEFPFAANGRALTAGHEEGFVRLVADGTSEQLLGGQIIGPDASELIAEIALAIDAEHSIKDIADVIHPHPTLSEAVMEAAADLRGTAIHAPE